MLLISVAIPRAAIIVLIVSCVLLLSFNFNCFDIPKIVLQLLD
jgi:hypothetical protein